MGVSTAEPRNPGPSWSFSLFRFGVRVLPVPLQHLGGWIGASVAYWRMPEQRGYSRAYLSTLFGRPASRREVWKHFHAFAISLIAKIRAGAKKPVEIICEGEARERADLLFQSNSLLLGTFHVGASDLLGFHISETGRQVRMVRMRVGNSEDLSALARTYGDCVRFVWVNHPDELLFSLRDALQSDATVALQCDRLEGVERGEPFYFLGERRYFRTSIYRLSRIFNRQVLFCVAVPEHSFHRFRILAHPSFDGSGLSKQEHRAAAHAHFQSVLDWLEDILREHPYLWFNFLPLNPVAPAAPAESRA